MNTPSEEAIEASIKIINEGSARMEELGFIQEVIQATIDKATEELRQVHTETMTTETKTLPSESEHWYFQDGQPCYTIIGKNGKERATRLNDARKLDLVPSVTKILNEAAKPGLESWKAKQILEAALPLPKLDGE